MRLPDYSLASTLQAISMRDVFVKMQAMWTVTEREPEVTKAFNKVRNELCEVGLLAEGTYLEVVDLSMARIPSFGEAGYVYERMPWYARLAGYREGVIYLPSDLPQTAYVSGGTLVDVIRHEFGHAWHYIDEEYFEYPWFTDAFGAEYEEGADIP